MENQSEIFTNFKRFKLLVEKQAECKIKRLRIDGDGEYTSIEFTQWEKEGVEHAIIDICTPQHNIIVERKNISILNMPRSMLKAR